MTPELSFVDETYDTNITSSYFLSIQACLDGFSFATLDPIRNKYIQFKHFQFRNIRKEELAPLTEKLLEENELLNLPYKKVFVLVPSPASTLVPAGLFNSSEASRWLSFTHEIPHGHKVMHAPMKLSDAWNIFSIPENMETLFTRQFPEPVFLHPYIPIAETKLAINRPGSGRSQVIISLQKEYFDMTVLEKNNLKLCNSFEINGENDLIYFTLFVFEQLELTPAQTDIQVIGCNPDKENIIHSLRKYIKHVKQPGLPGSFQYSYLFKDVPGHRFFNLLSLPACV
ncbi:MAG: DUF3822 family protein [Marinilabiliaceae bacterium]